MLGYGALLDNSMGEHLRSALYDFTNFLRGVPFYWYVIALVALFLLTKLLVKK